MAVISPRRDRDTTHRAARSIGALPAAVLLGPLAAVVTGVRASVRRPSLVVAAAFLGASLPLASSGSGGVGYSAGDVISGLAVAAVAAGALRADAPVLPRRAAQLFTLITVSLTVSVLCSTDIDASLIGLVRWVQLFVLVPGAVILALRGRRDVRIIAAAILATGVGQGGVGVVQYLTGSGASYFGQPVRGTGTFGATDVMGMSIVASFAVVVAAAVAVSSRGRRRLVAGAVAIALLFPVAISFSRGSWLALGAALAVMLLIANWRLLVGVVIVAAIGSAALTTHAAESGNASLAQRLSSIDAVAANHPDQSVIDRYALWTAATTIWLRHPATGTGLRTFPDHRDSAAPLSLSSGGDVEQAGTAFRKQPLLSPHNLYLLVLSEQGLVGELMFLGLFGTALIGSVVRAWRVRGTPEQWVGLAATGLLAWLLCFFAYGDIGGPSSVPMSVVIGFALWWAVRLRPATDGSVARPGDQVAGPGGPVAPAVASRPTAAVMSRPSASGRTAETGQSQLIVRASVISMALVAASAVLGLIRDLMIAAFFGADGGTDAFLMGWTVPESAQPLLIEGAMALVMVPAFSRALASARPREAMREVVAATLPVILLTLLALFAVVLLAAPVLVHLLAPGLQYPELATRCMRIAAVTVPLIGLAGYLSAGLRAHHVFGPPAAIYPAFNVAVIVSVLIAKDRVGVTSAVIGISAGCALMVLVQLPGAVGRVPVAAIRIGRSDLVRLASFAPVGAYTVARQGQVFVERYLGSGLSPGTVSHLNYAQKIGQIPSTLTLLIATVTFPMLARSMALGGDAAARSRTRTDLRVIMALVLLATGYLVLYAPEVVTVLFGRGRFGPADCAATAAILRIYVLGIAGQAVVDIVCRSFFAGSAVSWYPARVMAIGLGVTALTGTLLAPVWGAPGIAAANALGITVPGLLLLRRARLGGGGTGSSGDSGGAEGGACDSGGGDSGGGDSGGDSGAGPARGQLPRALWDIARAAGPVLPAVAAGWWVRSGIGGWPPLPSALSGGVVMVVVFVAALLARRVRSAWAEGAGSDAR